MGAEAGDGTGAGLGSGRCGEVTGLGDWGFGAAIEAEGDAPAAVGRGALPKSAAVPVDSRFAAPPEGPEAGAMPGKSTSRTQTRTCSGEASALFNTRVAPAAMASLTSTVAKAFENTRTGRFFNAASARILLNTSTPLI